MKWSTGVVRVVDEATLTSCEHVLVRVTSRVNTSNTYAEELSDAVVRWMHEVWPPDQKYSMSRYMVVVAMDVDRMPDDLLDAISQRLLGMRGDREGDPGGIMGRAAGLLACWMRARLLEIRGHISLRPKAALVKREYELFFTQLLAQPNTPMLEKVAS